jgi:hypothetical protein
LDYIWSMAVRNQILFHLLEASVRYFNVIVLFECIQCKVKLPNEKGLCSIECRPFYDKEYAVKIYFTRSIFRVALIPFPVTR